MQNETMHPVERSEKDTWKGRTVVDENGKRWPDIDDDLNWEPTPGAHQGDFAVAIAHPYEQMVEQIMYGKDLPSYQAAVEVAIGAMLASLSDAERERGLAGMLQAGLDSGVYEGDPFREAFTKLRKLADEEEQKQQRIA